MRSLAACSLLLVAAAAHAGAVPVSSVSASSTYTGEGNYAADRATDGKQGTSWVEGDSGSGLGAYLTLELGGDKQVTGIKLWAGDWYSYDAWTRANRPKEIELKFSDDSTETVTLEDKKSAQVFTFAAPKTTSSIRVKLKSAYSGSTWNDTGISEIQVLGDGPGLGLEATIKASSEAPEDGDGTYVAANLTDGLSDSMWCEGKKDSDGTGEWLEFDFGGTKTISKLDVINGMGTSLSLWMKANRASTATLTFSDGSTAEIELKGTMRAQTVEFPAKSTSKVKLTFTGVTAGKEYNDLCISEAWFRE